MISSLQDNFKKHRSEEQFIHFIETFCVVKKKDLDTL